jgi:predicted lactoylglutathione lyase
MSRILAGCATGDPNPMNTNPFQHIDLRVNDLAQATEFYSKILPAIGFEHGWAGKRFSGFDAQGTLPDQAWFGFTEDKDHRANANRISFWAESRARVDELAEVLQSAGAANIRGPRVCPEYSPTYYAVFFEDPFGNCLEVCHRTD